MIGGGHIGKEPEAEPLSSQTETTIDTDPVTISVPLAEAYRTLSWVCGLVIRQALLMTHQYSPDSTRARSLRQAANKLAYRICNTIQKRLNEPARPLCKAFDLSALFFFVRRWFVDVHNVVAVQWCDDRETKLRGTYLFLDWNVAMYYSFLVLDWLEPRA